MFRAHLDAAMVDDVFAERADERERIAVWPKLRRPRLLLCEPLGLRQILRLLRVDAAPATPKALAVNVEDAGTTASEARQYS
jgi:hypothetical protein